MQCTVCAPEFRCLVASLSLKQQRILRAAWPPAAEAFPRRQHLSFSVIPLVCRCFPCPLWQGPSLRAWSSAFSRSMGLSHHRGSLPSRPACCHAAVRTARARPRTAREWLKTPRNTALRTPRSTAGHHGTPIGVKRAVEHEASSEGRKCLPNRRPPHRVA